MYICGAYDGMAVNMMFTAHTMIDDPCKKVCTQEACLQVVLSCENFCGDVATFRCSEGKECMYVFYQNLIVWDPIRIHMHILCGHHAKENDDAILCNITRLKRRFINMSDKAHAIERRDRNSQFDKTLHGRQYAVRKWHAKRRSRENWPRGVTLSTM